MKRIINFFLGNPDQHHLVSENENHLQKKTKFQLLSSLSGVELIEIIANEDNEDLDLNISIWDGLFEESLKLVFETQKASAVLLQQKFQISYGRASKIIDQLERFSIIGPFDGQSHRVVFIKNTKSKELALDQIALDRKLIQQFYERNKYEIDTKKEFYQRQRSSNHPDSVFEKERREIIPQDVMDKVWNRDGGKCVKCGNQKNLEFDHIIPFSKGGATTYRNLQLLCKTCNLQKLNKIG
jgi:hypothetical protein